jgi:hypothetical protein
VELNYPSVPPAEAGHIPRARGLLNEVFVLYRQQFGRWFAITAPTSLAAAVVLLMADQQVRAIFRNIPHGQVHIVELAEAGLLRFGGFFVAWLLGAFALGAVATTVSNLNVDDDEVWRYDSHQQAREHLGPLLLVALLTFCAFIAGIWAVGVVTFAIVRVAGWTRFSRFNLETVLLGYVIVSSIVSWFGMAIPLILRGNIGVWSALKRSLQLSNGYEFFLFLLVIESLVGSYVGWYATHYGLALIVPAHIRYTIWYGWMVYFVGILASAAVQPPMFIGFSLLAQENP